ncbi:MAG: SMI1/KNR4 family protein [Candidatus Paracaedibacteraceae bacterium]|nr:SMI1/KNR4 family protein [Candidatus Paracaedibacteraceae bacterium]
MAIDFLEEFQKRIESSGINNFFSGGKSGELISTAEKVLGNKFPESYRRFLEKYGSGGVFGVEIYGIPNDDLNAKGIPNTVWLTRIARKEIGLKDNLVIVGDAGLGDYYVLNCNQEKSGELLLWNSRSQQSVKDTASGANFEEFLNIKLNEAIESLKEE